MTGRYSYNTEACIFSLLKAKQVFQIQRVRCPFVLIVQGLRHHRAASIVLICAGR